MNNHFLCHIIRDIFPVRNNVGLYGDLRELKEEMLKPEHSIGSILIHTNREKINDQDYGIFWEIGIDGPYTGYNCFDLLISINYNPNLSIQNYDFVAEQFSALVKTNGIVFLVNPGLWASELPKYLSVKKDTIKELKRFSMLKNQKVFVYENI